MKAAAIAAFGGPEMLRLTEFDAPEPGPGEVRVRVRAAGVQPVDCAARSGWSPPGLSPSLPLIVGNEFAGVIDRLGDGVEGFAAGDEVLGFRSLGCYAEYVVVSAAQLAAKPPGMPWEIAGGLSGAGQTAHTAMEELRVGPGDTVLINGAAGGVGTVAVQVARERGAAVIATGREENHDYLRSLGAVPVTYEEGLADRIRVLAPRGVDAALDAAGGLGLAVAVELVEDKDRIGTIYAFDRYKELGVRWISSKRSAARLSELVDLYVKGKLRVHVRKTYPLEQAAEAHREIETGHGRGKIVLTIE
ncbi:NADP-dependent oxidoreductase [Paenibacillus arenilitoris]|uniref:NADP-dependent oxidoreductase n=1 Tax=Paenibacillus arenilitoris TaxID=2772299 RepID=A0A927CJQ0_9BACL|nr:NADP-dependent oxidoreductase [Paenibacillus arenilitoris]MBD2868779.1 NADP-dependent oxidoreductase [Paenibacillus arenilitoris]